MIMLSNHTVLFSCIFIFQVSTVKGEGIGFVNTKNYDPESNFCSCVPVLRYGVTAWCCQVCQTVQDSECDALTLCSVRISTLPLTPLFPEMCSLNFPPWISGQHIPTVRVILSVGAFQVEIFLILLMPEECHAQRKLFLGKSDWPWDVSSCGSPWVLLVVCVLFFACAHTGWDMDIFWCSWLPRASWAALPNKSL